MVVAFGFVAAAIGAAVVACDLEVDTKYGQHSGLQKSNLPNPPPVEGGGPSTDGGFLCGTPVDAGTCSVSYTNDIYPKMTSTWHCTDANCHGANVQQPTMLDNANDTYANLQAFKGINNLPYLNPCSTDPDASTFVCNVSTPFCGTAQMPFPDNTLMTGTMSASDLMLVTTWVQCGAPQKLIRTLD